MNGEDTCYACTNKYNQHLDTSMAYSPPQVIMRIYPVTRAQEATEMHALGKDQSYKVQTYHSGDE